MATIDLDRLLEVISPDLPAGQDLEYDPVFGEMERAAEGKEEQQFGDTIIPAEEPDWRILKTKAEGVLAQSKDLRAAVYLTKALIRTNGYTGLKDGLKLIQGLIDGFWDSLYPQLDPEDNNDPTFRINTLLNLCDTIGFLHPISQIPLVSSTVMGNFSLRDIQIAEGTLAPAHDEDSEPTLDQVDAAFRESPSEQNQEQLSEIRQAIESVEAIEKKVNEQLGIEQSVDLQPLLVVLKQAEKEIIKRTGDVAAPSTADDDQTVNATATSQGVGPGSTGAISNRDDVIRALDRLCVYYEQNEPSSPIPLLLQRARWLVKKDFFEIVQDLAPEGASYFDFLWKHEDKNED